MRIVFVTHQFPPNYNTGTELYAMRLAHKLRGQFGHDVRVFTFEPSFAAQGGFVRREETVHEGLAVTRVHMWRGLLANFVLGDYYNPQIGKLFATYLAQVRPDVVHFFHTAFLGASLIEEAKLAGVPSVVNLMDFWFVCPTAQLLKTRTQERCAGPSAFGCLECLSHGDLDYDRLLTFTRGEHFVSVDRVGVGMDSGLRWNQPTSHAQFTALGARAEFLRHVLLSSADRILAPSASLRDQFIHFGYPPDRIDVAPYGVDPMPSYAFERKPSAVLRVGFIGSINRPKGLHVLVDAFVDPKLAGAKVSLDVYGDPSRFPHYAEDCFARGRRDPRVRIRGAMKPEHVATALRDLDVLVVPSLWQENTPFVVLEARAAGVPVVASRVDGIAEIVQDGENGRLFTPGDAGELAALLAELDRDRAQVARLSGHFADVRTLLANAREFDRLYERLVAERQRSPLGVAGSQAPVIGAGGSHG